MMTVLDLFSSKVLEPLSKCLHLAHCFPPFIIYPSSYPPTLFQMYPPPSHLAINHAVAMLTKHFVWFPCSYVISTLELLAIHEEYYLVYLNGGTRQQNMPSVTWMKRFYQYIEAG